MTDQGVWPGDATLVAPAGTDTLYIALPTRTGGYIMLDGFLRLFIPSDGSTFDTDFTLYSTDEAVAGTSYEIQEA